MTLTGKKKSELVNAVESAVGGKYASVPFHASYMEDDYNETWFKISENRYVHVDTIDGDIVIEYCDDMKHRFLAEDGDVFYIGDFSNLEEMLQAIISEIEEE